MSLTGDVFTDASWEEWRPSLFDRQICVCPGGLNESYVSCRSAMDCN